MTDPTKLLNEALQLPLETRAALAAKLIDSWDADVDEDTEAAGVELHPSAREEFEGAYKCLQSRG